MGSVSAEANFQPIVTIFDIWENRFSYIFYNHFLWKFSQVDQCAHAARDSKLLIWGSSDDCSALAIAINYQTAVMSHFKPFLSTNYKLSRRRLILCEALLCNVHVNEHLISPTILSLTKREPIEKVVEQILLHHHRQHLPKKSKSRPGWKNLSQEFELRFTLNLLLLSLEVPLASLEVPSPYCCASRYHVAAAQNPSAAPRNPWGKILRPKV